MKNWLRYSWWVFMTWGGMLLVSLLVFFIAPDSWKRWIYFSFGLIGIALAVVDQIGKGLDRAAGRELRTQLQTTNVNQRKVVAGDLRANRNINISEIHNYYQPGFRPQFGAQLAAPLPYFVGREKELDQLISSLKPGIHMSVVGPGGIGKSWLVLESLTRIVPDIDQAPAVFPDGIIQYSFYQSDASSEKALEHIARCFHEDPRPTAFDAALRVLASKQLLLVLDSADRSDDIEKILLCAGHCAVLIATRDRQQIADPKYCIELTPLSTENSIELLVQFARDWVDDITVAKTIVETLGGLPLAIKLAGQRMAAQEMKASELLAELRQTNLAALEIGKRQRESVRVMLSKSVQHLDELSQKILGAFVVLGTEPVRLPQIVSILRSCFGLQDTSDWLIRRKLQKDLIRYGLINRMRDTYVLSHKLILDFARELLPSIGIEIDGTLLHDGPERRLLIQSAVAEELVEIVGQQPDQVHTNLKENIRKFSNPYVCGFTDEGQEYIDAILDTMKRGRAWAIAITGNPGVGKSRIAYEIGRRCIEQRLYDAVIAVWIEDQALRVRRDRQNSNGRFTSLDEVLNMISAVLVGRALDEKKFIQKCEIIYAEMTQKPTLLILDGLDYIGQEEWGQLGNFLERVPYPSIALLTSRNTPKMGEKLFEVRR